MNPLTRDIVRAFLKCETEGKRKREVHAAPHDGCVILTNGSALFEFEDAPDKLWKPHVYDPNKVQEGLRRLLKEPWTDVLGINLKKAMPVEEAGTEEECVIYETKRGNQVLMGQDYYNMMYSIVEQPTVKMQIAPGPDGKPRSDLRYFLIFEGRVLRGVIANRRV